MARIGILTSGGDAPGMNAALRAAVRCGTGLGLTFIGIERGYAGLIEGDTVPLDNRAVSGIIERGGTLLRSARSQAFMTEDGGRQALATIRRHRLDGLVVIGGNGSLRGAQWLNESGVPTFGVPASIDNDVPGSAMAIGVDTALNTVVSCLNRLRDTAIAHERAFVVEVMGRKSGYIALMGGLAGGAEIILLPEIPVSLDTVVRRIQESLQLGKRHSIIVVAEGFTPNDEPLVASSPAHTVCDRLDQVGSLETRLTILGHLQRGGSPTAFDRILASRFGQAAVRALQSGVDAGMMAYDGGAIVCKPYETLDDACTNVDLELLELADNVAN